MLSVTRKALGTPVFGLLRIRFIVVSIVLMSVAPSAYAQELSPEIQSRVARVEETLSSLIIVKDAVGQEMSLAARMVFHGVPAVSVALINNGRVEWTRA